MTNPLTITAAPMTSPSVCKFILNQDLLEGKIDCNSLEMAQELNSPLLEALFFLPQIREVLVSGNTLIVATHEATPDWGLLGKTVGLIIRSQIQTGAPLFPHLDRENNSPNPASSLSSTFSPSPTMIKEEIEKLLLQHINPAVASHGGKISLVEYKADTGTAYLKMEGGCQGCGQASLTLREGVEKAIKQAIPQIKEVVDVTDHDSGINPYY